MIQPGKTQKIHIVPQRMFSHKDAVNVVIGVTAVFPGTEDNLVRSGGVKCIDQLQGLGRSHPVVVKPARHDEGGNDMTAAALSPVCLPPEIIVVGMVQPLI